VAGIADTEVDGSNEVNLQAYLREAQHQQVLMDYGPRFSRAWAATFSTSS
jgi:hypothetical protein